MKNQTQKNGTAGTRCFDRKTFHTARRDRREALSRRTFLWLLIAATACALVIILSGCGGSGAGGQQAEPQFINPCACEYELLLTPADMKVLCKPCPPEVR